MGRFRLRLAVLAICLAPAAAFAQSAPPPGGGGGSAAAPPPPGGGTPASNLATNLGTSTATPPAPPPPGGAAPAAAGGAAPAGAATAGADEKKVPHRDAAGFTFDDKPRAQPRGTKNARVVHRAAGPMATFPGFEQLPDGGSRLFVQLSQSVPVEERRAAGAITYVLKGAHARVWNDTNSLVTVHFNTPVLQARLVPQGHDLLFVVTMRAASTPTFKMNENPDKTSTLQIDFPKGEFGGGDAVTAAATAPAPNPNAPKVGTKPNKTTARNPTAPPPAPGPTP